LTKYVAYYRVSTQKQGRSGLGVEAQEAAVKGFLAAQPRAKLIGSYVEVESGKRDDRPQLMRAMGHARLVGARVLVAKLDRLSRDAHFLLGLQKEGVKFTVADLPEANELTIGLLAILAQYEARQISERTKAALKAAKARGVKLGNPRGAGQIAGRYLDRAHAASRRMAQARAEGLRSTIDEIRGEGVSSANGIARRLNEREIVTPREGRWTARTVTDVLARL
jgi:DNA invertase Pin-like site-specific DNA recombinase